MSRLKQTACCGEQTVPVRERIRSTCSFSFQQKRVVLRKATRRRKLWLCSCCLEPFLLAAPQSAARHRGSVKPDSDSQRDATDDTGVILCFQRILGELLWEGKNINIPAHSWLPLSLLRAECTEHIMTFIYKRLELKTLGVCRCLWDHLVPQIQAYVTRFRSHSSLCFELDLAMTLPESRKRGGRPYCPYCHTLQCVTVWKQNV